MFADDGSEWQEAKPKRSHQRKEQQQQQQQEEAKQGPSTQPQQGLNGHSEKSSGHDRQPAAASAAQRGDPIIASLSRPKPEPSSRVCAQCGNTAHKYADALYLPVTEFYSLTSHTLPGATQTTSCSCPLSVESLLRFSTKHLI